jgi:hypothetical protein
VDPRQEGGGRAQWRADGHGVETSYGKFAPELKCTPDGRLLARTEKPCYNDLGSAAPRRRSTSTILTIETLMMYLDSALIGCRART